MVLRRHTLSKYVDFRNTANDLLEALWEACKRNKNVKPLLYNASLEAGKVSLQELQLEDYRKNIFARAFKAKESKV